MVKQNKNTEWNSLTTKLKVFSCVTISSIYQPNKDQGTGVLINHLHCVKQPTVPIWPSYLYTGQLKQHLTTQSQAWRNDLGLKGTLSCLEMSSLHVVKGYCLTRWDTPVLGPTQSRWSVCLPAVTATLLSPLLSIRDMPMCYSRVQTSPSETWFLAHYCFSMHGKELFYTSQ